MKFFSREDLNMTYEYVVPDDSLKPEFEANDRLIIDPRAKIKKGDYVLLQRNTVSGKPLYVIRKVVIPAKHCEMRSVVIGRVMSLSRSLA